MYLGTVTLIELSFWIHSRGDFYFGDDHSFNQTIFDETRSYWTGSVINVQKAANARLARVKTSNATNPTFSLTPLGTQFSFGETAAYILVLGDRVSGTVAKMRVEYLFGTSVSQFPAVGSA